eukprot:5163997-Pleurochrysis_carterae.AAC.1
MAATASSDALQEVSAAAIVISTSAHTPQPRRWPISAAAALRQTFSAASRPFSSHRSNRSPKGFMLFNACSRGQINLVNEYILGGVDVNWQDDLGFFALLVASKKGHCQVKTSSALTIPSCATFCVFDFTRSPPFERPCHACALSEWWEHCFSFGPRLLPTQGVTAYCLAQRTSHCLI